MSCFNSSCESYLDLNRLTVDELHASHNRVKDEASLLTLVKDNVTALPLDLIIHQLIEMMMVVVMLLTMMVEPSHLKM